jgi:hypothetical protein
MQRQNDRRPWNVRALLESTESPFAIAEDANALAADAAKAINDVLDTTMKR